jgi:hypothetical protein
MAELRSKRAAPTPKPVDDSARSSANDQHHQQTTETDSNRNSHVPGGSVKNRQPLKPTAPKPKRPTGSLIEGDTVGTEAEKEKLTELNTNKVKETDEALSTLDKNSNFTTAAHTEPSENLHTVPDEAPVAAERTTVSKSSADSVETLVDVATAAKSECGDSHADRRSASAGSSEDVKF